MLDMGFIPDIERIFKMTPFTRQTLFFSATMPPEIQRLTNEFLSNPTRIEVARQATAAETVTQRLVKVAGSGRDGTPKAKREALRAILNHEGDAVTNAIIFCNRKRDIGTLQRSLEKHGHSVAALHGDLDQSIRMKVLDAFRGGKITLLVASDVAARGLDIPAVSHVFNYDVPSHAEDYVHRIGRTGRAGRSGKAFTLATSEDRKYLDAIETMLGNPIPREEGETAPAPQVEAVPEASEERQERGHAERKPRRGRRGGKGRDREETTEAKAVETTEAEAPEAEQAKAESFKAESSRTEPETREPRRTRERGGKSRDRSDRNERGRGDHSRGDHSRGERVKGFGDHVPAFTLIPIPTLRKRDAEEKDAA